MSSKEPQPSAQTRHDAALAELAEAGTHPVLLASVLQGIHGAMEEHLRARFAGDRTLPSEVRTAIADYTATSWNDLLQLMSDKGLATAQEIQALRDMVTERNTVAHGNRKLAVTRTQIIAWADLVSRHVSARNGLGSATRAPRTHTIPGAHIARAVVAGFSSASLRINPIGIEPISIGGLTITDIIVENVVFGLSATHGAILGYVSSAWKDYVFTVTPEAHWEVQPENLALRRKICVRPIERKVNDMQQWIVVFPSLLAGNYFMARWHEREITVSSGEGYKPQKVSVFQNQITELNATPD